jgi:hypothetical protein
VSSVLAPVLYATQQVVSPQFPTEGSVIDTFNRANAATLGANWTVYVTAFTGTRDGQIIDNQVGHSTVSVHQQLWWNPASFGPDVVAYMTVAVKPTDGDSSNALASIYARLLTIGSGTTDGYRLDWWAAAAGDQMQLVRMDNAVGTVIGGPILAEIANGDKIGITCINDKIAGWIFTGGAWVQILEVTDATYDASGRVGLAYTSGVTNMRYDDFAAGTIAGPVAAKVGLLQSGDVVPGVTGGTAGTAESPDRYGLNLWGAVRTTSDTLLENNPGAGEFGGQSGDTLGGGGGDGTFGG